MRVAAIYDIHGNLPALEAVLREIQSETAEHIVVGGDVLPGPMPCECLALLLNLQIPVQFILGNGEAAVLAHLAGGDLASLPESAREAVRWNAEQLEPEHARQIGAWPATIRLEIPAFGAVHFCHATPRSDTEIFTWQTPESRILPAFAGVDAPVVVCGHTHMQFDRRIGATRVLNAGSVGMPFGEPGADWLMLGEGVQLRHTSYDLHDAARRVRATSYPQAEGFAAQEILQPRPAQEMLELFTRLSSGPAHNPVHAPGGGMMADRE
jgi:predicted phosphodiesterase